MKSTFVKIILPIIFPCLLFTACSEEQTALRATTEGLTHVADGYAPGAAAKIEVWSSNSLTTGYSSVYFAVFDSISNKPITDSHLHVHATMNVDGVQHICPVENPEPLAVNGLFEAKVVFMTGEEHSMCDFHVSIHNHLNGNRGTAEFEFPIAAKDPANVAVFSAGDGTQYSVSYRFANSPKVGVNEFEVIIFRLDDDGYIPADDLSIVLAPRMTAMGHGSPNNVSPTLAGRGHYSGKVNFTMTGEWTIGLELSDTAGIVGNPAFIVEVK
jgi:hypothetical protein